MVMTQIAVLAKSILENVFLPQNLPPNYSVGYKVEESACRTRKKFLFSNIVSVEQLQKMRTACYIRIFFLFKLPKPLSKTGYSIVGVFMKNTFFSTKR